MSNNNKLKPGWKIWRFDQMATNVNVRIDNPSESGMEHYIGLEHLDADSLKIRRWGTPDDVEATKLMFKNGDIIFGRRRAYQRKLGVAEFDGICSAHAMVLRAKPEAVLSDFLPFFMQSDLFMKRAVEISVGSLSPTINWKTMAVQEFSLPPIAAQEQLLKALNAFECAIVEQEALLAETNFLIQSFLADWWEKKSDALCPLGELSVVSGAYGINAPAKTFEPGKPRYIRITDIDSEGRLLGSDAVGVDSHGYDSYLLEDDDLLIARTGNTVGKSFLYSRDLGPAVYAGYLVKFRLNKSKALPKYIFWMTRSPQYRDWIKSSVRVGAQPNINAKEYSSLKVPAPSPEEQKCFVEQLDYLEVARESCVSRIENLRGVKAAFVQDEVINVI